MAQAANTADFFGEGSAAPAQAPQDPDDLPNPNNPNGMSNNELRRRQQALSSAATQTANINSQRQDFNAPVTPQVAAVTAHPIADYFSGNAQTHAPDFAQTDGSGNPVYVRGDNYAGESSAINQQMGAVSGDPANPSFAPPGSPGTPAYKAPGAETLGNNYVQQGQNVANDLTNQVLGTTPTTNPATDPTKANMAALTPVVDPALATSPETDRALAQSQGLIDSITKTPLQTSILGDQALSNQLAIANSARGGPGAVQDARDRAQAAAPGLLQQSAQSSIQEQVARAGAAGQAAGIYAGVATNDANRAANIATANQNAGLHVLDNLTALTGQQLQFDATKMQTVGQLARDYFANSQAFAQMDVQTQIAQWDDLTRRYGIDKNFDAQIKAISASKKIGPLDALKLVLGIGQAAGTAAAAL